MKEWKFVIVAFIAVAWVCVFPAQAGQELVAGVSVDGQSGRVLNQGTPHVDRVVVFSPGNPIGQQFSDLQAVLGRPTQIWTR